MSQRPDTFLVSFLLGARCETDVRSFKGLHRDQIALALWNDKMTIRRRIFRTWPRNPRGKNIVRENSCLGKCTSNGIQLWGDTIWDFFLVHPIPFLDTLISISTSSKLAKWMTLNNETEHASSQIEWAMNEADPRQIFPYPIAGVIEDQEMRIRLGICGKSMPKIVKEQEHDMSSNGGGKERSGDQGRGETTGSGDNKTNDKMDEPGNQEGGGCDNKDKKYDMDVDQPANAIFRADAHPAPWPLVPFSYQAPKIEQRLPLHLLPKKLVVHDPWDLLEHPIRYSYGNKSRCDWTLIEDKTYIYKLSIGNQGKKRLKEELEARKEKLEQGRIDRLKKVENIPEGCDGFILTPINVASGPAEPPIFVAHAIAPDPEPVEEAHLYISPKEIVGRGNHSLVLHAEWEVPRSLLVPDILCHECVLEDVQKTLAASDGEDGSCKDPQWKVKSGLWEEVPDVESGATLSIVPEKGSKMEARVYRTYSGKTSFRYSGPTRIIKTNVQWQNAKRGPYCSHILKRLHLDTNTLRPHPLTARVSLVAKLSNGDEHLYLEAMNYEAFPGHFFEHWTGYNIIAPLHEPTPVNAVIPQYYGYYELETPFSYKFLTPILLMENCGEQICVNDLNMDDKHECAALVFKFHNAGYLHNSVYPRNMLRQAGPLDRPMYQRGTGEFMEDGRKHVYRLIDFGRSEEDRDESDRATEESAIYKMLNIHVTRMIADTNVVV